VEVTHPQPASRKSSPAHSSWRAYAAFAGLAALAGPVTGFLSQPFADATNRQPFAGEAACSAAAGVALLAIATARGCRRLNRQQCSALLVLLLPLWCSVPIARMAESTPWLRGIGLGALLLLSVAAPLWLGLLAALDVIQQDIPRAAPGAAIAGLFAVCLVAPQESYSVAWNQAGMLLVQALLSIAVVYSWTFAAGRLAGSSVLMTAGSYLILVALGDAVFSLLLERAGWQPVDWAAAWQPMLFQSCTMAFLWLLWFWLLGRMALAAFAMQALAAWLAGMFCQISVPGLRNLRADAAMAIAACAIFVALRARAADEQPTALGLGEA
jgi:hypothetical protein